MPSYKSTRSRSKIGMALAANTGTVAHSHSNKALLDGYTHTDAEIAAVIAYAGYTVSNITSNTSYPVANYLITADATSGAITVTLPSATVASSYQYTITKIDTSANGVIITSSVNVAGEASQTLELEQESLTLFSNGVEWMVK